jgi:hypothetical protein
LSCMSWCCIGLSQAGRRLGKRLTKIADARKTHAESLTGQVSPAFCDGVDRAKELRNRLLGTVAPRRQLDRVRRERRHLSS